MASLMRHYDKASKPIACRSRGPSASEIKPLGTRATVDTIELFFRRPPEGLRTRIESILGSRIQIKRCVDKTGYQWGVRVIINRPTLVVLPVLAHFLRRDKWSRTMRVDVAVDFSMASEAAMEALAEFLIQHLVLKWRSARAEKTHVGSTVYWADQCRSRNLAMYLKGKNIFRLELRFLRTKAVRRARLNDLTKLDGVNPFELMNHHLRLLRFKPHFVQRAIQRTVQQERLRQLGNRQNCRRTRLLEAFSDRYQARIPNRMQHIFRSIDMQLLLSRRGVDRHIEKLPLELLSIPTELSWARTP